MLRRETDPDDRRAVRLERRTRGSTWPTGVTAGPGSARASRSRRRRTGGRSPRPCPRSAASSRRRRSPGVLAQVMSIGRTYASANTGASKSRSSRADTIASGGVGGRSRRRPRQESRGGIGPYLSTRAVSARTITTSVRPLPPRSRGQTLGRHRPGRVAPNPSSPARRGGLGMMTLWRRRSPVNSMFTLVARVLCSDRMKICGKSSACR